MIPFVKEDAMKKKLWGFLFAAMTAALAWSAPKTELYIYNWSYYVPADVLAQFEKENNVTIQYKEFSSNEEMYATIKGGSNKYDVVFPGNDYATLMVRENMLEKLDKSKLPNIANIDPAISAKKISDPNNDYTVPYFLGAAGIMVNKEKVPNFEKSWAIFSRPDLKGKMTLLDDPREVIGAALKYNGFSANSTNPAELAKAKASIVDWKKNILNFDSDTFGRGFATGDLWVVHCFAENVWLEVSEGQADNEKYADKYVFFIPKEGNASYMDTMAILKTAPHKEMAYKFINFIHDPKINAKIADFTRVPCVNLKARPLVTRKPNYALADVLACDLKVDLGDKRDLYSQIWKDTRGGE
jgi:spermidine/putrescine transport system substrate-binding protein